MVCTWSTQERNSLVMDVQVCAVRAHDMENEPMTVENEAPKNEETPKENEVKPNDTATQEHMTTSHRLGQWATEIVENTQKVIVV